MTGKRLGAAALPGARAQGLWWLGSGFPCGSRSRDPTDRKGGLGSVRLGSCRGQALTGRLRVPSLTEAYLGAESLQLRLGPDARAGSRLCRSSLPGTWAPGRGLPVPRFWRVSAEAPWGAGSLRLPTAWGAWSSPGRLSVCPGEIPTPRLWPSGRGTGRETSPCRGGWVGAVAYGGPGTCLHCPRVGAIKFF
jgi:hypothetical protein